MSASGLDNGYGSPFVRMYFKGVELTAQVTSFKYEYYEEGDDVCSFEVHSVDRTEADMPQWQRKAELQILWGFLGSMGVVDGQVSPVRKIYVQDIKWKFEKDGIIGNIEATEKAVSLKYEDTQEVYKNTTLPNIVAKIAEKTGLQAFLDITPNNGSDSVPLLAPVTPKTNSDLSLDNYLQKNQKLIVRKNSKELSAAYDRKDIVPINSQNTALPPLPVISPTTAVKVTPEEYETFMNNQPDSKGDFKDVLSPFIKDRFIIYPNVPGANKTLKQVISELGKREADGPWILDSRDDTVTLKRRNFSQAPYKSYTYGGDEGSLISYSPMTKERRHGANSKNVGFTNWDAVNKVVFQANADAKMETDASTSEWLNAYHYYKRLEDNGLGNRRMETLTPTLKNINSNSGSYFKPSQDNLRTYKEIDIHPMITVTEQVQMLQNALTDYYNQQTNNNTYNPLGNDPNSAFNMANNDRRDSALKNNPATASIFGDPNLITGILITVLKVGKKFSGNHYVIKATHEIDKNGYLVNLEMATQGNNIKATDSVKTKGKINNSIGPSSTSKNQKKRISIKNNP